jgi:hydrogenase expression/formation protein HypC
MCLAIPSRVIAIAENRLATIDIAGVRRRVALDLVPDTQIGDYVIVHAGFAIQRLDEEDAQQTLQLFERFLSEESSEESIPPEG